MRRGVSEIIGAVFVVAVLIVFLILLVYMFNIFREAEQKLESKLRFEQKLLHSEITIANFTYRCTSLINWTLFTIKLYPGLASHVKAVACTLAVNSSTRRVVPCNYVVSSSDTILVNVSFNEWTKMYVDLVMSTGDVVSIPLDAGPTLIREVPVPGVDYAQYVNGTYRGVLFVTTVFRNNYTGWVCLNATLNFSCTSEVTGAVCYLNGTSSLTVNEAFCIKPLSAYITSNTFNVYCEYAPCIVTAEISLRTPSCTSYNYTITVMRIYP